MENGQPRSSLAKCSVSPAGWGEAEAAVAFARWKGIHSNVDLLENRR